jgi:hypothetical protein
MYGILSDVMVAGLIGVCVAGLVAGIYLTWKGLSGIWKG